MNILYANKNKQLKKHVGTIQCSNGLSLLQRKISNALLFHAYDHLLVEDEYQIEIKELCQLIGYDSNDHQLIKNALKKLLSTVLEWNLLKEGEREEVWTASSILSSVSLDKSICRYSYSSHMKKLLYMPSMYGRIDMITQSKFKSAYALALYENVIRYQNLPQTCWFQLDMFRKLMGVSDSKYKVFRDFKKRIIEKAVMEVNSFSPLEVKTEYRREGRAVKYLRFLINNKKNNNNKLSASTYTESACIEKTFQNWGFSNEEIKNLLSNYPFKHIESCVNEFKSSASYKEGKVKSLKAYFLKIISNQYGQGQAISDVKKENKTQPTEKDVNSDYQKYLSNQLESSWEIVPESRREAVIEQFERELSQSSGMFLWPIYQRDGLSHRAVKGAFNAYLKASCSELLKGTLSFEEYKLSLK